MPNKPELADKANIELNVAAEGFSCAGALFRAVFSALVQCDGPATPDVLSLLRTGSSLCDDHATRCDEGAGYFEDLLLSLVDHPVEESLRERTEGDDA